MFCQAGIDQCLVSMRTHLLHLSMSQAIVLALWSLRMLLACSCALSAVNALLAEGLQQKENTVRQRLREGIPTPMPNVAPRTQTCGLRCVLPPCWAGC